MKRKFFKPRRLDKRKEKLQKQKDEIENFINKMFSEKKEINVKFSFNKTLKAEIYSFDKKFILKNLLPKIHGIVGIKENILIFEHGKMIFN